MKKILPIILEIWNRSSKMLGVSHHQRNRISWAYACI